MAKTIFDSAMNTLSPIDRMTKLVELITSFPELAIFLETLIREAKEFQEREKQTLYILCVTTYTPAMSAKEQPYTTILYL